MPSPIVLFDPSPVSNNLGDAIIADSVRKQLFALFPERQIISIPTHDYLGRESRQWIRNAPFCMVGGTNLLSSNFYSYRQWKINVSDIPLLRNKVILMGVGWWQYQERPSWFSRMFFSQILCRNPDVMHSVRDDYTRTMLASIGIHNVLNTTCPTLWELGQNLTRAIPRRKADAVLFTVTDYLPNKDKDKQIFEILTRHYNRVVAWPQGQFDIEYLKLIGVKDILPYGLHSVDQYLKDTDTDYVGTRLHCGIRALQNGRRSCIIGIDNRSVEIAKNTQLPVLDRNRLIDLPTWIMSDSSLELSIPKVEIYRWKEKTANAYNSFP